MQLITSKDNPRLKAVRALLRSKKERQAASAFVMEGVRALGAIAAGTALPAYRLREIWVSADVPDRAAGFEVPVYGLPPALMEQLSDCQSSQGVLGLVQYDPPPLTLDPQAGNYLLADRLTDPGNLGTLIRSAVAFGFRGLFLRGETVEVFNPKTVRAAMGALPFLAHWAVDDALPGLLERSGYVLVSTAAQGGEPLPAMRFGPRNVLVIGNEAHGVSPELLRRAARRVSIPMTPAAESLNAGVAGSICMYAMSTEHP